MVFIKLKGVNNGMVKIDYAAKVKRILESEGMQLIGRWYKIDVWNEEDGAWIDIFVLDRKGMLDLFALKTNEEGYIHPGLAISKILEAWYVSLS